MVTVSTQIPSKLNSSLRAIAKKRGLGESEVLRAAVQRFIESENNAIHIFENDDEIRDFSHSCNSLILSKLD